MLRGVLILLILCASNCLCLGQQWVTDYQQAQQNYADGNYENALSLAKASLNGFLEADGSLNTNYTSILRLLTTICYQADLVEQGISYAEKEVEVRQASGADEEVEYATCLYNLGSFYELSGDHEQSISNFRDALDIYNQYYQPSNKNVINCKWKIAASLVSLGKNDEAFSIYQETLNPDEAHEQLTSEYITAIDDYSNLLIDRNKYQEALPFLLNLENIYYSLGEQYNPMQANTLMNLGLCNHHLGDLNKAEEYYNEAEALLTDKSTSTYAQLKNLMAVNYQKLGKTNKASEMLAGIQGNGNFLTKASALNNEASILQQQGETKKAIEYFTQALNLLVANNAQKKIAYIETLDNLSLAYLKLGKADSAHVLAEEAITKRKELGVSDLLISYLRKGEALQAKGLWNKALENYNEAKTTAEQADARYPALQGNMAIVNQELGNYAKAEQLFNKQLNLLQAKGQANTLKYATALNNKATLMQIQANFLEAEDLLEESLNLIAEILGTDNLEYVGVAENLALVDLQLGKYQSAEKLLQNIINVREAKLGKDHPAYANAILNMGRLKQQRGKYQEAEPLFSKAVEINEKAFGINHPNYAFALNGMALLYQTMGNFSKSEELFSKSVKIYENVYGSNHPEYATALENLATLKKLTGKEQEAARLLETALEIDKQTLGTNHPRYATTLHNLASIYKDLDQYEKSVQLFEEALTIDRNVYGENHQAFASTLYNLAVLQQELKQIQSAEENFIKALEIREETLGENHPDYAYSLYGLAGLYHLTKKYKKARKYYDLAISNYLVQIDDFFPSLSEKEKSAFYGKIKPVIESFQDFAIEYATANLDSSKYIIGDLYDLQLSTKALLLHSSNKVRNRIYESGNQELIDKYQQWTEMKEQLSKYLSYSAEDLSEQNIDISAVSDEINTLEKFLSQQSQLFANEVDKKQFSWINVKDKLNDKEAAVEIIRIKKRYLTDSILYAALVVHPDSEIPEMVILNEGKKLEDRFFNYYRNAIKFTVGDEISYREFWAPIDDKLNSPELVYASADGVFNKININTLFDPKESKYVIDEYNVRSISNTKEIITAGSKQNTSGNTAAVFGFPDFDLGTSGIVTSKAQTRASSFGFKELIPDLPGTKKEVEELNLILNENGWKTDLFTREKASESQVKNVSNPKVLHIATHGFFMQDIEYEESTDYGAYFKDQDYNPLFRSGLLLAGAAGAIYDNKNVNNEDGILTAYEAMNLNLDETALVVMSACETGVGEVKNGEGVYGLQRSFLVAGAESVIMSLWQVDDYTTQRLMVLFYKNWLSGQDKFMAFKNAEIALKKEFKDPFHWGAFIILGVE